MSGRGSGTLKQHDILMIVKQVKQYELRSLHTLQVQPVCDRRKQTCACLRSWFLRWILCWVGMFESQKSAKTVPGIWLKCHSNRIDPSIPLTPHVQAWSLDCWCLSKPPVRHHSGDRRFFWDLSSRSLLLVPWVAVLVSAATSHFPVVVGDAIEWV